jgi:hypothetical protein
VSNLCPGPTDFKCCLPPNGESSTNGPISRSEIISRGQYWIKKHVPYNGDTTYPDPDGVKYRTDCSGFVSMALHTTAPGVSTVGMINIAKEINPKDLQPGDFVGVLGEGTAGSAGHVTLFLSWVDATNKSYKSLECMSTNDIKGCVAFERPIGWGTHGRVSKAYRYIRVK